MTIAGLTIANGKRYDITDLSQQGGGGVLDEPGATVYITNDVQQQPGPGRERLLENWRLRQRLDPATAISGTTFVGNQAIGLRTAQRIRYLNSTASARGNGTAEGGFIDDDGNLTLTNRTFSNNQLGVPGSGRRQRQRPRRLPSPWT